MDRRTFIKSTTAAAAAATATTAAASPEPAPTSAGAEATPAAPALAKGLFELSMGVLWPEAPVGFRGSAERLARRIEVASGRRFRIVPQPISVPGGEAAIVADVDLFHGTEHHNLGWHRALAYFAGLPGFTGLDPHELHAWLTVAGGQSLWDDLAAEFNLKSLMAGHTGKYPGLWLTRPLEVADGLVGLRLHVWGATREVVRRLGATTASPLLIDAPAALAAGAIDGAEWGGPMIDLAAGLPAIASRNIRVGLAPNGHALSLGMRRSLWDRLGDADRAIFEACCAEETRLTLAEAKAHERIARDHMVATHGVVLDQLPPTLLGRLSDAAQSVVEEIADIDARARRIHASYMSFLETVNGLARPDSALTTPAV